MTMRKTMMASWPTVRMALLALGVAVVAAAAAGAAPADRDRKPGARADDDLRGLPLAKSWADTAHVGANRVTLDDIIADIGRQQRANRDSLRSVAFTYVVTTVHTPDGQPPAGTDSLGTWDVQEEAFRVETGRGRTARVVKLWDRKREFERGVARAPREKLSARPTWQASPGEVVSDLPFTEGSAKLYRYERRRSVMVGSSLVHEVSFAPKDRFAPLPSGTIWVDIADWAIRRIDVRFDGPVPFPWVIRAIPRYRLRQADCGGVWFPILETIRAELRQLPIVQSGGIYDLRVELRDIVINGEPCECGADLDAATESGATPAGDEAVEGAVDPAAFWSAIDDGWHQELPVLLQEAPSLAPAQLDSLSRHGAELLARMPESPPWHVKPFPLAPAYNRAQGFVPRGGLRLERVGRPNRLVATLGRGFSDHRVEWTLAASARPHARLTLQAAAGRATGSFAGDGRPGQRLWSALPWGTDPNHYFDRDAWTANATWSPTRGLTLNAGGSHVRELPLATRTDWNVLGRRLRPAPMRAADALDADLAALGFGARRGAVSLAGAVERAWVTPRGSTAETIVDSWRWAARLREQDGWGNTWTLSGGGRGLNGAAPAQWRVWLGDLQPADEVSDLVRGGSLCGWPAGTLLGDRGLWASASVGLNVDPWRALKVPVLRGLGLQPELFAEWAGAWGAAGSSGGVVGTVGDAAGDASGDDAAAGAAADGLIATPPTGWRADVGLGFSRRVDLPLIGLGSRLFVRGARAVGQEAGDQGWRVLVGIGR